MKKNVLVVVAALILSGQALAADPIVIKFSSAVKLNTPKGQGIEKFKELAEKYTNGRVIVEAGHDNAMVIQRDEVAALLANKIQMIAPAMSKMEELYEKPELSPYSALDVPYLFKDETQFAKWVDSPVAADMAATVKGGAKPLSYWTNGFKMLSTNKAINTPADLKGLSIRMQPSVVVYKQLKVWGAQPREINFGDTYITSQYNVVDGTESPASNFDSTRMYETQKYLYKTYHAPLAYAVIVNAKFWNGLPPETRTQLERAMKETFTFVKDYAVRQDAFALQHSQATGLVRVLDPTPEVDKFLRSKSEEVQTVLSPIQKEYFDKTKALLK